MQVLIVDDNEFALEVLDNALVRLGHTVVRARNGQEAMEILRRGQLRLVVTDWEMPVLNGIELCKAVRHEDLPGYIYVIMLTGNEGTQQRLEGLYAGADDFINKPLDQEELLVCMRTAERILSLETRDVALFSLAKLAESRDPETGAHIERVQSYTRLLAQNLAPEVKSREGVDDEFVRLIYQTSPLHDLGKVAIPDAVLLKPGRLTQDEFAIMKTHTLLGARTLDAALERFPNAGFLQMARDIAATHHEWYDGTGYPRGMMGNQIPLCGRLVALADVYDALTSRRVYKDAISHEQSKAIILQERGTHFDPEVVDAFLHCESQFLAIHRQFTELPSPEPIVESAIPPAQHPMPAAAAHPCRILLVEDHPEVRRYVERMLQATGAEVLTAENGQEALRAISKYNPNVVVSDWVMPVMDGLELCRQIRATQSDPLYFIMLTARTEKSRLIEAYDAGVNDFIAKPCDLKELLAHVRAGMRETQLYDELSRKAVGSQQINAQLATLNNRLQMLSISDDLTGLFNRRHAMNRLQEQLATAEKNGRPLTVALIDIDHFKKVNDTWGHAAGDVVLRTVADILRQQTQPSDVLCRIGGEEFLAIFPSQTAAMVGVLAEKLRQTVAGHPFALNDATTTVTISIGIATRTRQQTEVASLLKAADQAMYAAKHGGRNTIRTADAESPNPSSTAPAPTEAQAQPAAAEKPPIDLAAVRKRCGGDATFATAVIERFRAQAGHEVGRLEEALAAANATEVCRISHNLKSMAGYVAAESVADLARRIEGIARSNSVDGLAPLLQQLRAQVERALAWIAQAAATPSSPQALQPAATPHAVPTA